MIEMIKLRNFKSLGEVSLPLSKFICLIGMNGAGKSTVLQAFDFLSQLMVGDVQSWLDTRGWSISDLNCKLRKESNISFGVEFRTSSGELLTWVGDFNRTLLRCTGESITLKNEKLLRSDGSTYSIHGKRQDIAFTYQGSILSALKDSELPLPALELRAALRGIRSLELLSPQLLRKSARVSEHDIGVGGEKLSAYLDNIKGEKKDELIALLQRFYPTLIDFKVTSQKSGWKKLSVHEQFGDIKLETDATHLNDGLLRILAVLAQSASNPSLILLDEIENGINQEIIEMLVDTLVASPQQILVTTHSPLILNYLADDDAIKSVKFIYKTPQGESRIRSFFEIPRIGEKLQCMGPGEAFVDTDLTKLTEECVALDNEGLLSKNQSAEIQV